MALINMLHSTKQSLHSLCILMSAILSQNYFMPTCDTQLMNKYIICRKMNQSYLQDI